MSIGNANISTSLVASSLGVAIHDVGTLCSKASVGGVNTSKGFVSAFSIVENGNANTDGKLISGALPLYNIFSTGAPAIWRLPVNPAGSVFYQLLHDSVGKYMFSLGGFRGYNPSANAPSLSGYQFDAIVTSETSATFTAEIVANVGSYDWTQVLGATGIKLTVWDGTAKKGQSEIIPIQLDTNVLFTGLSFTENKTYDQHKVYNLYLSLINGITEIGRLPVTNTVVVNIVTTIQHANELSINLPEDLGGSFGALNTDYGTMYRTYTRNFDGFLDTPIYLRSINYVKYNSSNVPIDSLTVYSFGTNDAPLEITRIRENIPVVFKADASRLAPNTPIGEWVSINMQYDY